VLIVGAIAAIWAVGLLSLAASLPAEFWQDSGNDKSTI